MGVESDHSTSRGGRDEQRGSGGPERLFAAIAVHPRRALLLLALAVALAAAGLLRFRIAGDVGALLERSGYGRIARLLQTTRVLDTLLIDVSLAGEAGEKSRAAASGSGAATDRGERSAKRRELIARAEQLADRLRASGAFSHVLFRVSEQQQDRLFSLLFSHRFFLLLPPRDLRRSLQAAHRDLMLPAGGGLERLVFRDPLDHRSALLSRLELAKPPMQLDVSSGVLLSRDGLHALLVAEPTSRALDLDRSRALLAGVRRAAPRSVRLEMLGAPVYAVAAASSIRRDVEWAVALTALMVALLAGLAFRGSAPVIAALVPVACGCAVALGLVGWSGHPLPGLALAFGAVIIGVGVDYGIHLLTHLRARARVHPDEQPARAAGSAASRVLPALTLGLLTTLAGLATLPLVGFRLLDDVALFTSLGVTATFAITLVALPAMSRYLHRAARRGGPAPAAAARATGRPGRAALVLASLCALVTLCALVGLFRVRFDGDIRNLDYQPPRVRAREARFSRRYNDPRYPTLVVASGASRQQALRSAERVAGLLRRAEGRGDIRAFVSLAKILPSRAAQRATLARYHTARLRRRIDAQAGRIGLRPATFAPFFSELRAAKRGEVRPLSPRDLAGTPLERLARRLLVSHDGRHHALTIVYMGGRTGRAADRSVAATALPVALRDALAALPGVAVYSKARVARETVVAIQRGVVRIALVALALIAAILLVVYRRASIVLYALLPIGMAFVWTFGLMALADLPFNIVSIGAFALVAGIGVDYGIFVTDAALRAARRTASSGGDVAAATAAEVDVARGGVLLACCTTLAGFCSLLVADSPVMWSLGLAVSLGVIASVCGAGLVLPLMWWWLGPPHAVVPHCPRCGDALRRSPARATQLTAALLVILAGGVVLGWLQGTHAHYGGPALALLAIDALLLALLLRTLRRRRWICRRCCR